MPLKLNSSGGGAVTLDAPSTASLFTLTTPAVNGNLVTTGDSGTVTPTMLARPLTLMTAQDTTSGTAINFNIPTWAESIKVILFGVSLSGTDRPLIRLGTSAGLATSGYQSYTSDAGATSTAGFILGGASAGDNRYGFLQIVNQDGFKWVATGITNSSTSTAWSNIGQVTLAGDITQLTLTRTGTNTFDAGSVSVMYQ